jgi:hypothetical protein
MPQRLKDSNVKESGSVEGQRNKILNQTRRPSAANSYTWSQSTMPENDYRGVNTRLGNLEWYLLFL